MQNLPRPVTILRRRVHTALSGAFGGLHPEHGTAVVACRLVEIHTPSVSFDLWPQVKGPPFGPNVVWNVWGSGATVRRMTHPVGDQRTGRPDAVGDGDPPQAQTPVPNHTTCHPADIAEDAARRAVEGRGVTPGTEP